MASYATVVIDGNDVTNYSINGSWTPRLNRPAQAQVTLPMDVSVGDAGSKLRLYINGGLVFHGFILNVETDTGKDGGTTVYNAMDPMELWQWRPVRDDDGDYSDPSIITDFLYAPDILFNALVNTQTVDGEVLLDLDSSSIASGVNSVEGAPTDWPMTIAELASLLISTGQLDVVIRPVNPGSDVMGIPDFHNGDYGTDLSGSVNFQYGTGAFNVDSLRWNRDMTNMVNAYTILGGPKIATAADPKAVQHWCYNITADDPGLASLPGFTETIVRRVNSQFNYAPRLKIDIFDGYDDNCVKGIGTPGRELQRWLWMIFSFIAAVPREIIHITPTRDTAIGTFGIGDIVGIEAVSDVRGGFSGKQRVYEYTISWDEDSVLALSELQTSADADFAA